MVIEEILGRAGHFPDGEEAISDVFHRFVLFIVKMSERWSLMGVDVFVGKSVGILLDAAGWFWEGVLFDVHLVADAL